MPGYRIYEKQYPYFLTITVVEWMPLFLSPKYVDIITESLRFCQNEKALGLHGYVLMPHHLHLISSSPSDLAVTIGQFKSFTAHEIVKLLDEERRDLYLWIARDQARQAGDADHKIWQDGFHPEQIYSREFYEQKLNYIHQNPVRIKLVAEPHHWLNSSAGYYAGGVCPLDIQPAEW